MLAQEQKNQGSHTYYSTLYDQFNKKITIF